MEQALSDSNSIHFDLTNMNDINNVLNNKGQFANAITSQEIRYIRNNWHRFKNNVRFYNKKEVNVPWNS